MLYKISKTGISNLTFKSKLITIMLLLMGLSALSAQAHKQTILLQSFAPLDGSNKDPGLEFRLQSALKTKLELIGYTVELAHSDILQDNLKAALESDTFLVITGFYERKPDSLNTSYYAQIYNPEEQAMIDALNIIDERQLFEGLNLDLSELKEKDSTRITELSEKIIRRIHSNPHRSERRENIDENVVANGLASRFQLPLSKFDAEAQTQDVFQILHEDVVITATRKKENISDAPASVSVISGAQIRKYGYRSLPEALAHVPEVYVHYNGHNYSADFRGFFGNNVERRVLYQLNGMKLNDRFHFGDFYPDVMADLSNVERIEVVRGPGAALYGNNAVLGVVNIII